MGFRDWVRARLGAFFRRSAGRSIVASGHDLARADRNFTIRRAGGTLATIGLVALAFQAHAQAVANNVQAYVVEGSQQAVIDVLGTDSDSNNWPLTVTAVSAASHGASSIGGGGAIYVPTPGYSGPDSFTYTVSDAHGGVATGTVNITVQPLLPAPAVSRITAPMVTPAAALTYYGSATTRTADPSWAPASPEIAALARALGAGRSTVSAAQYAQNVYDYIRNNIATEFRFGLGKGARGALIDQSGTPFDQAELMMKLLRLGSVSAQYQLGQITLTPQQFGQWTGIVTGLNQTSQTFTVNAQTACQFLADGGIPAVVNNVSQSGNSYCTSQVSGNLTAVTMLQIWVKTTSNAYLFDPSFKRDALKTGVDLAASMGCGTAQAPTCASSSGTSVLTSVMSGATTGTLAGTSVPYVQNLNEAAALAQMTTYATALQNTILATPTDALEDVAGGGVIDTSYAPVVGASLPYATSGTPTTWTGDVPDQYRTMFTYSFCGQTLNVAADEMAGRRLRQYMPRSNESGGPLEGVNPDLVISSYIDDADVLDCNLPYGAPPVPAQTGLALKPPYAASSGSYGATSLSAYLPPFVIFGDSPVAPGLTLAVQVGESSDSSVKFLADLQEADPNPFANDGNSAPFAGMSPCDSSNYYWWCHLEGQATSLGRILAQQSRAQHIAALVANAAMRHHGRLGFLQGGNVSITSSISTESNVGDSPDVDMEMYGHLASLLEGSSGQQQDNSWEPMSGVTNFILNNRNATKILDVIPSNMASVIPLLSNYVFPIGYGGPIDNVQPLNLQALANAGYESIIPQNACIGFTGPSSVGSAPCNGNPLNPNYEIMSGSVAMLLSETLKGATDPAGIDPAANALAPTKRATESQLSAAQGYAFDAASGNVSLRPTPDIVTGSGAFPESLPFQRIYQSGIGAREDQYLTPTAGSGGTIDSYSGPDSDNASRLGGGWQHNYQITAQISTDASIAMGQIRGIDAAAVISGAYIDYLLLKAPTFQSRVASLFVDYWTARQIFENVVHIKNGATAMDYDRMPSGAFDPPAGVTGQLTETGLPVPVTYPGGAWPTYDYMGVGLVLTNKDGSTITFDNSKLNFVGSQKYGQTVGAPQLKADTWSFPTGITVTFAYTAEPINNGTEGIHNGVIGTNYILNSVTNNLGRSLTFSNNIAPGGGQLGWIINSISDDYGRVVSFALSNCPALQGEVSGAAESGNASLICDTFTVAEPDGAVWSYAYAPGSDSPDPAIITKPAYHLRRWFTPDNQTTAYETVAYDQVYRAATATDILGHADIYYPSALAPTDWWKRTDEVDAIGNLSTSWFDSWNDLTQSTDPLLRTTTYAYDGLHRRVLETRPEGDQATTVYDVRSNVVQQTNVAKPGSPLATTVTGSTFEEGPTVAVCVNPVICNKPAATYDALAWVLSGGTPTATQETSLTYNATTGQATQVLGPADPSGNRPETDLAYTTLSGISFLTSKTQKISVSPAVSTTTAYAYNAANKYVLRSATVDPTGLDLITGFAFDGMGDVTGVTDPRGNVTNFTWDPQRRLIFSISPSTGGSTQVAVKNTYDLDGQLIEIDKGTATSGLDAGFTALETMTNAYDAAGNEIQTSVLNGTATPALTVTQKSYDADDRLQCTAIRMNSAVFGALPASACAQSTNGAYGSDHITQLIYDGAGQKLIEQRGVGSASLISYATWTWSGDGNRTSVQDANGNTIAMAYDGLNRLATVTHPDGKTETRQYDADGDLTIWTNRGRFAIVRCYDALHRKVSEAGITGATNVGACPAGGTSNQIARGWDLFPATFAYDLTGRMTAASSARLGMTWAYDLAGRPTGRGGNWTTHYAWDGSGNLASVTYPEGSVFTYGYDAMNRTTAALQGTTTLASLTYDPLGRRNALTFGDASSQTWGYDAADRVTSLAHAFPNTADDVTATYAYDPADEEVSGVNSNAAYDWSPPSANVAYAAANALNQYPSVGSYPYTWWPEGPLKENDTLEGEYDENDRLMFAYPTVTPGMVDPNDYVENLIDPVGHLMYHDVHPVAGAAYPAFYHSTDGIRPETVLDWQYSQPPSGSASFQGYRRYVLGPNPDERWAFLDFDTSHTTYFPHTNRMGSTIALSANGAAAAKYQYGPYGESSNTLAEVGPGVASYAYRYTGQRLDGGTGLIDYKARFYSPALGRFLQPDQAGTDQGPNLYLYVADDPVDKTDPTGKFAGVDDAAEATAAVVAVGILAVGAYENGQCSGAGGCIGVAAGQVGDFVSGLFHHDGPQGPQTSEARSKPGGPDPDADGRGHSIPDGKGGYTTYGPRDPVTGQPESTKQYRPAPGAPHGPIQRPNVKDRPANTRPDGARVPGKPVVRPPQPGEAPQPPPPPPPKPPGT